MTVASLGVRPMFEPPKELLVVHLFDFHGDLYGQTTIEVALHFYLRPEANFDGLDTLRCKWRETKPKPENSGVTPTASLTPMTV